MARLESDLTRRDDSPPSSTHPPASKTARDGFPPPLKRLAAFAAVLLLAFAKPLFDLARYAFHSDLFSYILLIPFISLYLIWQRREGLERGSPPDKKRWCVLPFGLGLAIVLWCWMAPRFGRALSPSEYLACTSLGFYLCLVGCCLLCLSRQALWEIAFPIVFLIFIVPFPDGLTARIESGLQHASAHAAHLLFVLTGMPVFMQGLVFQLPGMRLEVAPECSGIHSTLVLFITSLLAGQILLGSPWNRAVLALAVIPLGVLRNGVRICTIGQLCVHVSPRMIDSPIHHRGGPLFFLVSLVPLFLLLYYFRRLEMKKRSKNQALSDVNCEA